MLTRFVHRRELAQRREEYPQDMVYAHAEVQPGQYWKVTLDGTVTRGTFAEQEEHGNE